MGVLDAPGSCSQSQTVQLLQVMVCPGTRNYPTRLTSTLWALGVDDEDDGLEAPGDDDELEIDHKV